MENQGPRRRGQPCDQPRRVPDQAKPTNVVGELEKPHRHPGTKVVGERLLALWKGRGGPYFFQSSSPWHGTDPYAEELRPQDLLEVHIGAAQYRRWDEPIATPEQYWLELTDAGRQALANTP